MAKIAEGVKSLVDTWGQGQACLFAISGLCLSRTPTTNTHPRKTKGQPVNEKLSPQIEATSSSA